MALKVGQLYAVLGLDQAPFKAGMASAKGEFGALGTSLTKLGAVGGLAVGGVIAGAFYESIKAASKFQQQMEMVNTQAHAGQAEVDSMSKSLLQLAGPLGSSPEDLARSLYHVESAGFRGAEALSMVTEAAKLAKVGNADFDSTTQAVIATMAAFGSSGMTATKAVSELNAIVGSGDMRMQALADSMGTGILSTAKTFGLSLTDVGAALATMTDNAVPAIDAATRIRMSISLMGAPSGPAIKALHAIGLNATDIANDMRKPNGFLIAMEDLQKHLSHIDASQLSGGLEEAKASMAKFGLSTKEINEMVGKLGPTATEQAVILSHAFGGGRSSAGILTMLSQMDRLKQKYTDIGEGAAKFGDDWAATTQTMAFKTDAFKAVLNATAISFGTVLAPAAGRVLDGLTGAINTVTPQVIQFGKDLAAALNPTVVDIGKAFADKGNQKQVKDFFGTVKEGGKGLVDGQKKSVEYGKAVHDAFARYGQGVAGIATEQENAVRRGGAAQGRAKQDLLGYTQVSSEYALNQIGTFGPSGIVPRSIREGDMLIEATQKATWETNLHNQHGALASMTNDVLVGMDESDRAVARAGDSIVRTVQSSWNQNEKNQHGSLANMTSNVVLNMDESERAATQSSNYLTAHVLSDWRAMATGTEQDFTFASVMVNTSMGGMSRSAATGADDAGADLARMRGQTTPTADAFDVMAARIAEAFARTAGEVARDTQIVSFRSSEMADSVAASAARVAASSAQAYHDSQFPGSAADNSYVPNHYASGGRPPVGRPSLIGEHGPELWVPDQAGTVVPNGKFGRGGRGGDTNIYVSVTGGTNPDETAGAIRREVRREMARTWNG